jgi:signal peptidase II
MVKKEITYFTITATLVLIIDQLTKFLIAHFSPNLNILFIKIHLVTNTGAGFGILAGKTWLLAIISLLVFIGIILYYKEIPKEKIPQLSFSLLLGGVAGNMIDRFFRGYVIDFIDLSFWPVFNIADMAITFAVIGLIYYYWKK